MALLPWLPVTLSFIGLIITLSAFIWQVRRARFNQSIDLLFRLENDFFRPAKRLQRVKAARDLLNGQVLEAEPILDFFETMALLLRRGALDKEIVKHTFFYWIDNYYEATRRFIAERQRTRPVVWKDLTTLVGKLRTIHREQVTTYHPPTSEQVAIFLAEEQAEAN